MFYHPFFDNPRYADIRGNPLLRDHYNYRPNQDGLFSLVILPGPGIIGFSAGLNGEKPAYLTVELDPEDLKAHPGADKRPVFAGGLAGVEAWNAYRLIDAKPSDKPLTMDIPVRPKH